PADANFRIGLAVTSHDNTLLTAAKFWLGEGPPPNHPASDVSESLLKNAPFDQWSSSGQWTRDGSTAATVAPGEKSALWREVDVEPGKRYVFTVSAKRAETSKNDGSIELRLEGTL